MGGFSVNDFWYYHKYQIMIGIGILILGMYYIAEILGKKQPDYELALVCGQTVSDEFRASLEAGFLPYLSDVNGDGEVIVRVNSYYYGAESGFQEEKDADRLMGGAVQLAADLKLGISRVYITDDAGALDGGTEGGFEKPWLEWNDSKVLREMELPDQVHDGLLSKELTNHLVAGIRTEDSGEEASIQRGRELWNVIKKGGRQ